ncbi:MAG: hypothetical protein JW833_08670, partial [Prolixibacteraceae bacterium]|nr:hypothetical protein [Prolixibacteraceae bacterium]
MIRIVVLFLFLQISVIGMGQTYYWVGFTDKDNSTYSIENPEEFLSERAIQRRQKQAIAIDELDFPINQQYIDQVVELGADFVHSSKWLNGITVRCDSLAFIEKVS